MWLVIEPVDVWMFRDGKPFNSGEGHFANSIFPPTAITVQGMLRNLLIEQNPHSVYAYRRGENTRLTEQIGDPNTIKLGNFFMSGPYLACWDDIGQLERYFPLPADVAQNKREELHPRKLEKINLDEFSDLNVSLARLQYVEDEQDPEPLWIPESVFVHDYLAGRIFGVRDCRKEQDLFSFEIRSGIGKDYSKNTVKEGLLYSASFVRLAGDVCLLVKVNPELYQPLFPDEITTHYAQFGGEGRLARIRHVDDSRVNSYQFQPSASANGYKAVLLTPAWIENPLTIPGLKSAAYQRPLSIGGWDMIQRHPRPIRQFLRPGSVFFFGEEIPYPMLSEDVADMPALSKLGFGEYLVGTWSYQE